MQQRLNEEKTVSEDAISNLANETRHFDPPAEFAANANVTAQVYDEAEADQLGFWAKQAERLDWGTPFTEVLDWSNPPFAKSVSYTHLRAHETVLDLVCRLL